LDLRNLIYSKKNEEDSEVNTPNIESESKTNKDLGISDGDNKSFNSCDVKSSKDSFEDDFNDSLGNGFGID